MLRRRRGSSGTDAFFGHQENETYTSLHSVSVANQSNGRKNAAILYVHGAGRHDLASIVKRGFDFALFQRDLGDNTKLAYWADILHSMSTDDLSLPGVATATLDDLPPLDISRVPPIAELPPDFVRSIPISGVSDRQGMVQRIWTQLRERYARELVETADARIRQENMPCPGVRTMPDFPGRRRARRLLTQMFLSDAYAYWFDIKVRAAIQTRLKSRLATHDRDYVLITHGLGCIVAWDVLNQLADEVQGENPLQIPLWITLGSPLGLAEVREFLYRDEDGKFRVPPQIATWRNFADPEDPIALNPSLQGKFNPGPSQIMEESPPHFQNPRSQSQRDFNAHHSAGYMETPAVRQCVAETVGNDFIERSMDFLVARNITDSLTGDPHERHPVLLELHWGASDSGSVALLAKTAKSIVAKVAARRGLDANGALRNAAIDPLERFVAANLTSEEIDVLCEEQQRQIAAHPLFYRVWSNSEKSASMHVSAERVQCHTARIGYNARGQGIGWAVLDSGIRTDHPHFVRPARLATENAVSPSSIVQLWNCTNVGLPEQMSSCVDRYGHGTHVAGIIAGSEEWALEARGIASGGVDKKGRVRNPYISMAPETDLYIFKVLDDNGKGRDDSIMKALQQIRRINDQAGRLIIHGANLSLGGPFDPKTYGCGHSPLCVELRRLWRSGVLACVSAGNEASFTVQTVEGGRQRLTLDLSIGDPANLEEAIAVGSVSRDFPNLYGVSYFSSRGPTADGRNKPDVVAPGERITSCDSKNFDINRPTSWYREDSGTSMACPHVSGVLAAFLSARPEFQGFPDKVKQILMAHATDLGRDRNFQGTGIPNLVQMLLRT